VKIELKESSKRSPRKANLSRKTAETEVNIELNLDGSGQADIKTNIKFLTHMLELLAKHAQIDLQIECTGDLQHHIVEDVAIVLGQALQQALGEKRGITRYGFAYIPMDEALARCVLDLGGRAYLVNKMNLTTAQVEDIPVSLLEHFLDTFVKNANINLHLETLYGQNDHHKVEAIYKALARALKQALSFDSKASDQIPSSKGVI
jgi:imidazoleglycerol-phosphate dehydratase